MEKCVCILILLNTVIMADGIFESALWKFAKNYSTSLTMILSRFDYEI